ncbi:MAG: hypothetical protein M1447_10605 [Gammaproteobacteria bacterium]|nr:hypothetical protein [Gammaproteobacteria bacterium]
MIKRSMVIGLLSAGVVAVPGMALASAQVNSTPIIPVSTQATVSTTAAQADQAALAAVGGGTVTSTSTDTYQGASVYDIHVLFNSVVYDVKVLQSNDSVVLKKVSSESSTQATVSTTAAQADQAALAAVGGGTVTSTSTDTYQGASVYDIHVLFNSVVYDVKVLQSNDSVVLKKVSSESSTQATVSTTAAQADQAALAAVGGGTVTSTSTDTYQGASVYDIHVLFNSVVYDVKVLQSNDSVVLKKVSSESSTPAATTQSAPAESQPPEGSSSSSQTTSGSTTQSAPAESQPPEGSSSSSQTTSGSTTQSAPAESQPPEGSSSSSQTTSGSTTQSAPAESQPPEGSSSSSQTTSGSSNPVVSTSGITYGVKLTAVPSIFQSFVAQALTQNHGTLKWVKFTAKTGGETQANIKISLSQGGTVKVIDLISTTGQLISQTVNS